MPRYWIAIIFVAIGAVALSVGILRPDPAPVAGQSVGTQGAAKVGGPFTLTDHMGNRVSDTDYRGQYMLIYFGYTFCPDVCPSSLSEVADALDALPSQTAEKIQPLLITIDPERDTAEVLASYVPHFHERLIGLTGSVEEVRAAAKVYRAYFSKNEADDEGNYFVDHTSYTYLMGPDGAFVTAFRHGTPGGEIASEIEEIIP